MPITVHTVTKKTRLCHTWRSIRFLFPIIPVPHFPPLQFGADNSSPAFSSLAFSAPPQLQISSQKCFIIDVGKSTARYPCRLGSEGLTTPENVRDLGVVVDSHLCFSDHIANITRKAHQRANLIHRCFFPEMATYWLKLSKFMFPDFRVQQFYEEYSPHRICTKEVY